VINGKTQNERGSIAGSVITMLDAMKQMREINLPNGKISQMASANPAKLLGIEKNARRNRNRQTRRFSCAR
jgi:N-acetylglucosamine-6-phosphate deacetylase